MRKGIPALLLTLSLLLCGCRLLPERIPPAGLTVHFIDVGRHSAHLQVFLISWYTKRKTALGRKGANHARI